VLCANPKQRELSWYMLFFQHPEAEELLAADDWALLRQFMSKNANEQEVQAYIDALSQPGGVTVDDFELPRVPSCFQQSVPICMMQAS
jgi:hypothetical protein